MQLDKYSVGGWMYKIGSFHKNWTRRWFVYDLKVIAPCLTVPCVYDADVPWVFPCPCIRLS